MPGPTPNAPAVAMARLAAVTGANDQTGESITVHFNPTSLQLQLSNELKDTKNNERKQYVARTSAKLTMDLVFDTTDSGEDVSRTTRKVQGFLAPPLPEGDRARQQVPPPLVLFEWGTLRFKGIVESYKETIDFFSPEGVPLRSAVNLTLSRQDQVFDESPGDAPRNAGNLDESLALETDAGSAAELAKRAQSPAAARALAAANGQENLRFGSGGPLSVTGGVPLKPPVAFADSGSGASQGRPAGISGVGAFDPAAAAGLAGRARLSASEGAFAGLCPPASKPAAVRPDIHKLLTERGGAGLSTESGSPYRVGGRAGADGPAGLRADVGNGERLSFDRS
jgi:hypothetical protein